MRAPPVWILALLPLAGCTLGSIEHSRTVPEDPATVAERLASELPRLGFVEVERSPGAVTATAAAVTSGWAICGPILVGDGDDRYRMVGADRRHGSVRVTLTPAAGGGTTVAVFPSFTADYRDPNKGIVLERACRSGGTLEGQLLQAAAG